jgi:hypothetical protein
MMVEIAADAISELLEIRKLQRGTGGDLSSADHKLLVEIANAFVKAGGTLTGRSVTVLEQGIARSAAILRRHLSRSMPERAWDVEFAHMLGVAIPAQSIADALMLWDAQVAATPFPDGFGPWGAHPVWAEESYGIGHTRTFVRILFDGGRTVPRGAEVAAWTRAMQSPVGAFACEAEFERLYRERHRDRAARRDHDAREGWKRVTGENAPAAWPHSDLEDAWNALDRSSRLAPLLAITTASSGGCAHTSATSSLWASVQTGELRPWAIKAKFDSPAYLLTCVAEKSLWRSTPTTTNW